MPEPSAHKINGGPAPPLRVWLATAVIAILAAALSIPPFLRIRAERELSFIRPCSEQIAAFTARGKNRQKVCPKIVVLGTSRICSGLFFDEQMEEFARQQAFGEIRFLRLARVKGTIDHFLPLFDQIIDAKPDILFIEADSLFFSWEKGGISEIVKEHSIYCRNCIKRGLRWVAGNHEKNKTTEELVGLWENNLIIPQKQDVEQFQFYSELLKKRQCRRGFDPEEPVAAMLRRAYEKGVRIVILDLPRSELMNTQIPASHKRLTKELSNQLGTLCAARFIVYPGQLGLGCFADFTHLNDKGRELFSRWLLSQIKDITGIGGSRCS